MTALHRVKAYFGMVPADELDAYDGYDDYDRRYDADRAPRRDRYDTYEADRRESDRRDYEADRADRRDYEADRYERRGAERRYDEPGRHLGRLDDRPERSERERDEPTELRSRTPRPRDPEHEVRRESAEAGESADTAARPSSRGRSWATNTGPNHTSVRPTATGSARSTPSLTPVSSTSSGPVAGATTGTGSSVSSHHGTSAVTRGSLAVDPEAARRREPAETPEATVAPAEITSLQPTSYNEARVIGERYRDGIPVIMNLTEMDDAAAKRLVDFAAGLAFALRGSIEKVTSRVFLLSPPNVEVSAAERRKLAENSYSASS